MRWQVATEGTVQEILQTVESIETVTGNLEAVVVDNGGTNFNERIIFSTFPKLTSHKNNLILNIAGKGILHTLSYDYQTLGHSVTVQIDGGEIHHIEPKVAGQTYNLMLGFNDNLKIYSSASVVIANAVYSLE